MTPSGTQELVYREESPASGTGNCLHSLWSMQQLWGALGPVPRPRPQGTWWERRAKEQAPEDAWVLLSNRGACIPGQCPLPIHLNASNRPLVRTLASPTPCCSSLCIFAYAVPLPGMPFPTSCTLPEFSHLFQDWLNVTFSWNLL